MVISAINSTTLQVTFSDGVTKQFTVPKLHAGANSVTIDYLEETFNITVNYAQGTSAVENIEFISYRNIRVTFNDVVDEESATDATNYYFEIVDGDAAYGALPTLQESNQLSKIETTYPGGAYTWWTGKDILGNQVAEPHIVADSSSGKTIVDIYLPEDARFTSKKDKLLGTYPDEWEDAERTLAVELKTSKTDGSTKKLLTKDTVVNVAVRNIKDTDGNLSINTEVIPIRILDEVKPELLEVKKINKNGEAQSLLNDDDGLGVNLTPGNPIEVVRSKEDRPHQLGEALQFVYSEPVFDGHDLDKSDLEYYRDLQLYVNGKLVAHLEKEDDEDLDYLEKYLTFEMGADATYNGSRVATLDVQKLVEDAPDEVFATGKKYHVEIIGVTDLAGNIEVTSQHEFDVKFKDTPATPPTPGENLIPVVEGIEQVADNMFRIEFNRAGATADLVIENPDGEGFGTLTVPIDPSVAVEDEDGFTSYISYVAVPARDHEYSRAIPDGIEQNEILAYDGDNKIWRTIRVQDVKVEEENLIGDDFIVDNMMLVNDTLAPEAVDEVDIEFEDRDTTIEIPVMDATPWAEDENVDYWVSPIAYQYNEDELRFENEIEAQQQGADTYKPVKVSYVDVDGKVHQAMVSNYDLRPSLGDPSDLNPGFNDDDGHENDAISFDFENDILTLDLENYPQLLDEDGLLVEGATYKVEIPAGYFTDAPKTNWFWDYKALFIFNETPYFMLYVDDGRDGDNYIWWEPFDAGLGYTSTKEDVTVTIGEDTVTPPVDEPEYVPQTSKQLINYDEPSRSIKIEFTGTIDSDTLKDKGNYSFNGKTLAEWDAELGTDTVIDFVVDDSNPEDVHQYAVFVIPQDSIKQDGDYEFTVEGVAHPNGGTMTPVKTVVRLHDNYRPVVTEAIVTGDSTIKLTFNEPVQYHVDPAKHADPHSTANNFLIKVGDLEFTPDTAVLPDNGDNNREIILNLGNIDILSLSGDITVEIVKDQNDNILVIDFAEVNQNPMKEDTYNIDRP